MAKICSLSHTLQIHYRRQSLLHTTTTILHLTCIPLLSPWQKSHTQTHTHLHKWNFNEQIQ